MTEREGRGEGNHETYCAQLFPHVTTCNSIRFRELLLNQNYLRVLPYELGKLFQLQVLGLQGNPLSKEVMALYGNGEPAGTNKLLMYMLDNLQGNWRDYYLSVNFS